MAMKPEDRQKIIDAITTRIAAAQKEHAQPVGCPICGQNNWDIGEDFVSIGTADVLGVLTEGKYLPSIVLVCTTCGNQQFMNLVALGLGHLGTSNDKAPLVVNATSIRAPIMPPPPLTPSGTTGAMERALEEARRGK
jgi:hypothetical protein